MPRTSKNIKCRYPLENMINAVEAAREGMSIRDAATKYGVPRSSLGDRVSGRIDVTTRPGKESTIPMDIETAMVEKAMDLAEKGFGVSKKNMQARAGTLVKSLNIKNNFTKGVPGRAWWAGLKKRHPALTLRKPEKLTTVRARSVNKVIVGNYFIDLNNIVKDLPPTSVWNMDETAISLEHKPTKVVARQGIRSVPGRTGNSRETVTVLPCVNAAGGKIPPLIIVKGKTEKSLRSYNTHEGPENALWGFQKNSYMNDSLGVAWFEEVFLKSCGPARPQLLVLDSHHSHETLGLLEAARQNNIHVLALPPHSTHYLCPLDRTVFGPFKKLYDSKCSEFMSSSTTAIVNKLSFPKLLSAAYNAAFSRKNIVSGFESTGIYEWNPLAIPKTAFAPSDPFDKDSTTDKKGADHPLEWVLDRNPPSATVTTPSPSSTSPVTIVAPPCSETITNPTSMSDRLIIDVSQDQYLPTIGSEPTLNQVVFAPDILDAHGNTVGELHVFADTNTEDIEAATILANINDSHEQDASWSDIWNTELNDLFHVAVPAQTERGDGISQHKPKSKLTTHRLLTSDAILENKRTEQETKEKQLREKEDRKRKREAIRKLKVENKKTKTLVN